MSKDPTPMSEQLRKLNIGPSAVSGLGMMAVGLSESLIIITQPEIANAFSHLDVESFLVSGNEIEITLKPGHKRWCDYSKISVSGGLSSRNGVLKRFTANSSIGKPFPKNLPGFRLSPVSGIRQGSQGRLVLIIKNVSDLPRPYGWNTTNRDEEVARLYSKRELKKNPPAPEVEKSTALVPVPAPEPVNEDEVSYLAGLIQSVNEIVETSKLKVELRIDEEGFLEAFTRRRIGR